MNLNSATLTQWRAQLGSEWVITDPEKLAAYESATFATTQRVFAALFPESVEQVQSCMRVANDSRTPIYAISRGRNCGYGSTVPYRSGSVILDLSRLDRISDLHPNLASVRVQAGVTQSQLCEYLRQNGDQLWMDPISTFSDCSVLANILERGHGMSAFADRVSSACDYEVVLPNGELIRTGFSAFPGSRLAGLDKWAPGPQWEGLFSQSNLGIVTSLSVALLPKPECMRVLGFAVQDETLLPVIVDRLRPLRLDGTLRFGPRLFNDHRLIQTYSRYPWERMHGKTPLSDECKAEVKAQFGIPTWTGLIGFFGSADQVAASERRARLALGEDVNQVHVCDLGAAAPAKFTAKYEQFIWSSFQSVCGQVKPVTERPRWRQRRAPNDADWSKDQCGIIWCPVSAPFVGADVMRAMEVYYRIYEKYKFEPDLSISCIRERTLELNSSLVFDREDPGQESAALACANEVLVQLSERGYSPHRVGLATHQILKSRSPQLQSLNAKLKSVLDPHNILSPGRYIE